MDIQVDIRACVRSLWFWQKGYLKIPMPDWAGPDALSLFWRKYPILLRKGRVVWGHTIQANQLLFEPGRHNCPGEVVYDLAGVCGPRELSVVARKLYALKGTRPEQPELAGIANYLTDEMVRTFGLAVPEVLAPSPQLRISSVFFHRGHLPGRMLASSFYPLLVSEETEGVVMVLPGRWWPAELAKNWEDFKAANWKRVKR